MRHVCVFNVLQFACLTCYNSIPALAIVLCRIETFMCFGWVDLPKHGQKSLRGLKLVLAAVEMVFW